MNKSVSNFISSTLPSVFVVGVLAFLFWGPLSANFDSGSLGKLFMTDIAGSGFPGEGFESGDNCGYVTGSGDVDPDTGDVDPDTGQVLFDYLMDNEQGCVAANGYFYEGGPHVSYAYHSVLGKVDLTFGPDSSKFVYVDPTTGYWAGFGRILPFTYTGAEKGKNWVWFNWTCAGCDEYDYSDRVHTDMSTGEISGYAWSDYLYATYGDGYLLFDGLTQELPELLVSVEVDVLSNDGLKPAAVTPDDAPLADGYEYWRVRTRFKDIASGDYLAVDDISTIDLELTATGDSNVYLNQVINKGEGILESSLNSEESSCSTDKGYCVQIEADGSVSFNTYVYAGAPTSNMVGMNDDTDAAIDYSTDRDACRWIYYDQWKAAGFISQPPCPNPDGEIMAKADYYQARSNERNYYAVNYVTMKVEFSGTRDVVLVETDDFSKIFDKFGTEYVYDFADDDELSFRPRYQVQKFIASWDGEEHTSISDDMIENMQLVTEATVEDTSSVYKGVVGSMSPKLEIYYQLDVDSSVSDRSSAALLLIMDSDKLKDEVADSTTRTDTMTGYAAEYIRSYAMGYGQDEDACSQPGVTCGSPANTVSNPTAEQWVCDYVAESRLSGEACYFTAYLPLEDRHRDPEDMSVIGAINASIDEDAFLEDSDGLSILGTASMITLRNRMYAQIARYTLGQSAAGGKLNSNMEDPAGNMVSLLDDTMLFAGGNVTVNGSTSFANKTLVVMGGNVYIDGNVSGGRLGIIVMKKGGIGGNLYIAPGVTDLYANIFLDGSLFSYDGTAKLSGVPNWASEDDRVETLLNQLYLNGSLVSKNTINGADDSDSSVTSWTLGDGSSTSDHDKAVGYDLNLLRQFRQCYDLTATGAVDTSSWGLCEEGEKLSTYGEDNSDYSSLIIEYAPAEGLPIFETDGGLFN